MLKHGPGESGGVQLVEPPFDGPVPNSSGGKCVGRRGKQRRAGGGFTTRSYAGGSGGRPAAMEKPPPQQPNGLELLTMPTGVLSVRASSQVLASRIAGYSRTGDNDLVRQALMTMLSADWTTPGSATVSKATVPRVKTLPATAARKPQSLPPIATSKIATLLCDPHLKNGDGAPDADPPHWVGTRARQSVPANMSTRPFGAESRHTCTDTRTSWRSTLGPGDIESQVAAVAQRIRATRPSTHPTRSPDARAAPTPPRRSLCVLAVTSPVPPVSDIVRPVASRPMRPIPRVAETSEDRARRAADALTNRYTVRIGAAADNAQIIGRADPTWLAAEIQRCSTHPGASDVAQIAEKRAQLPNRATAILSNAARADKQPSSRTNARTTTGNMAAAGIRELKPTVSAQRQQTADLQSATDVGSDPAIRKAAAAPVREVKTQVAARRHQTDRQSATGMGNDPATYVTGRTMKKPERLVEMMEHDMAEENGLTGWEAPDE